MLVREIEQPLDSIESAHEFIDVLAHTVTDAIVELRREEQKAMREGHPRKAQAISLALFKCKTLDCHLHKSRRALNDLRMLRRITLDERGAVEREMAVA